MIELLLIWFALSARSPNIEPNPFDYEFSTGYDTHISFIKSDCKLLWERENGIKYSGRIHNHDFKYVILGEYVKTAKDISNQKVIVKYPFKHDKLSLDLGLINLLTSYEYEKTTAYLGFKTPYLELEFAGYTELDMFKGKAKYKYDIKGGFFIEPSASIYYKDEINYSAKVKIGYKWKKLMK